MSLCNEPQERILTADIKPLQPSETRSNHGAVIESGTIEELGYVAVYRRVFRSLGNMCLVIAVTSGWIIPNAILLPQVLAIAELASSMPINGSFYWWAGALAPPRWSHAVSLITGWLNVQAMFAATAAFAYAVASSLAYAVAIAFPSMIWTNAEIMCLSLAVLATWGSLMTLRLERIAFVYMTIAILILLHMLVFVFGLPIAHKLQNLPFVSAKTVFGEYSNFSDWGLPVAIPYSWFGALWVNSGWVVPVYVTEETHNARIEIPKSLYYTFTTNTVCGLVICLISAFCINDMEAAAASENGYPLMDLIYQHWGQAFTATFLLFIALVGIIGGSGTLLTYAGQIAAFARDGGFPWHERVAYVHPRLNLPIYSVAILGTGTFLVLIVSLSPKASSIMYSIAVVTGLITFLIPVSFRIFAGDRWVPGPWNLGRWSMTVHITTVITQVYLMIMECFPTTPNWTVDTFNYAFALTAAAVVISCGLYWTVGRKNYKGLNLDALEVWRHHTV
uniref:Putative amino-acid permease n=1 Tax=Talaromyces marneffei PM1 TaxID=1077442 RepID=A0A093VEJ9_TALMA